VGDRERDRVREAALALPAVTERMSHGALCFFVQNKRPLCYYHDNHRGDGRVSLWCPAAPGVQDEMVASEPERFFAPTLSATGTFSGWLGIYLDTERPHQVDWDEISAILEDAFRLVAPKYLVAELANNSRPR
jgi:hypothetical protein